MQNRQRLANAIRALSMDAVQHANSGHPGMPMGMADIAEVVWNDFLSHNPKNPNWANRDRFILSNGHGSMLHYSLLHLTGYDLSIEDIKQFRQLNSKTPGHPEFGYTPGVETTTGPLGQGLANAVGMAIAERHLASEFNRTGHDIIDHFTYVFVGDGCLMEGISHEVCSLAGTLGLGKLIVFWDDNGISIDGNVEHWFSEDTVKRFEAYHWHVVPNVDGHDSKSVIDAIHAARAEHNKPSLICCSTTIGWGAPTLAGSEKSHGSPLGEQEIAATREKIAWPHAPFVIPDDIYHAWDAVQPGSEREAVWNERMQHYQKTHPALASELIRRLQNELPNDWSSVVNDLLTQIKTNPQTMATRKASEACLNTFVPLLPELMGGSADLTGSNNTRAKATTMLSSEKPDGNYIYYGVREFGMSAIMNGLAIHGGFIPFGGTFLVFCDYARNAVRMAALMKQRVIFVYTHDSIGLGEDGPTHQPIEHITMLRATPNVAVWRPADQLETAVAWTDAIEHKQRPSALLLSRQNLPAIPRDEAMLANIKRGAYTVYADSELPETIIIATGSEVALAIEVAKKLQNTRVVSMPCADVFEQQEEAYRESVLPSGVHKRVAIEAASPDFWYRYVGFGGLIIGLDTYGESAPAKDLFEAFGFTPEQILEKIKRHF